MSVVINGGVGVTFPDSVTQTSGVPSPGTSGNVLTSNGTIWISQAAAAFDSGTRMMFAQTSAPTGWTKDTTNYNNYALRVVTGTASTGGSVDFTTAFASQSVSGTVGTSGSSTVSGTSDATTLSISQIPSHNHPYNISYGPCYPPNPSAGDYRSGVEGANYGPGNVTSQGGGGSHTHSFTSSGHTHTGGTFTGTAINMAVKYLDVITATKN